MAAGEKKFQESHFDVLGICCPSEVPIIENILKPLDGVREVSVIVPTKTVIVLHDGLLISQLQIVRALNKASLEASIKVKGGKIVRKKWPSPYAIASGACLLLSLLGYFFQPLHWLALGAVAFGILPIISKSITALRNRAFGDINILVVITVAGSIALKDYWEAGTIVFLFAIADWLESLASHKAAAAMSSLLNVVPQRALLAENSEEVDVGEVKINTVLAVKEGEMIPIDGVVIEGNCDVDEKTLTGESFPVAKQKDSSVWAGTMNVNGYISIRTTALAEDCVVARMTKLVEEAQKNKSRIERYMEKFAKYYTPGIILISIAVAVVPVILRVHDKKKWFHIALVVLVSACPCALILSTPVAMFCALTKAANLGVFFKGSDYLEMLARVKIMAFDKTGTLTRAEFGVTEFKSLANDISQKTILYWVSSIESKSSHPMAAALVDLAKSHSIEPNPDAVEHFQNFPGEGIYGKIDGKEIYIGNAKIASRVGSQSVPELEGNDEGKSVGYIFLGSTPAGIFRLSDVCRTGAKEALQQLKSMGIKTVMITGDCYAAAKHIQDQLDGAPEVIHADLLPEDKARIIEDFQKQACTAMIGDGINDAPALATADVGISMGVSGSSLATETGHVMLMTNDIQRIPKVAKLARKVKTKILQNIILSIATKGSILGLAIAGHPMVWAAVLADVGTCLVVILNSMLLLNGFPRYRRKCCQSSAASTEHKHGKKCSGSDSLHKHQPCCPDKKKAPKQCDAKKCSSKHCAPATKQHCVPDSSISSASGKGQYSESIIKNSCCGHESHENQIRKRNVECTGWSNTHHHHPHQHQHQHHHQHPPPPPHHHHHHHEMDGSDSTKKHAICSSTKEKQDKTCSQSDSCHAKQPCCADLPPQPHCEVQLQQCSSNANCSEPNGKQICGHNNEIVEAKFSDHDHGSCNSHVGHQEPTKLHHHGGGPGCCDSTKKLGKEAVHDHFNKTSAHGSSSSTTTGLKPEDRIDIDEELGKIVELCCDHESTINRHSRGKNHHHDAGECDHSNHSGGHNLLGDPHNHNNHVHHHHQGSRNMACVALESRHVVGGCCESFRKECCVHSGHFGTNLRGGLTEIVIE
ncbi:OLC1v1035974C1 [Oldenlandia corymbosa var. corymbosa]|uniref:OLC1v1035974C1 n=1 Tax=Oldenlandia corymbosa var. corymbosa TaxID=529605 RepID=A0AAV1CUB7_OLDCO|nr:OLC1v1035974C1 [Oldenlandia corymbosa var. corymbosa]